MPMRKAKKGRTTYSLAVKDGKKYKPLPRRSIKSKKPVPDIYAVKKVNGRVVKSRKL